MAPESSKQAGGELGQLIEDARDQLSKLESILIAARAELTKLERTARSVGNATLEAVPQHHRTDSPDGAVVASSAPSEKVAEFSRRFQGREDAFATRWVSRKTGKAGWSPSVKGGFYTDKKTDADLLPLTTESLERHLRGSGEGQHEFHVGLYPMITDDRCKLLACDFDGSTWKDDAAAYSRACAAAGIASLAEISRSGDGAHIWIFFEDRLPASVARRAGMALLRAAMQQSSTLSLASYDRFFPAQDSLPTQSSGRMRLGNLIALPLQGDCRRRGTTVFADPETWEPYGDQFDALSSTALVTLGQVEDVAAQAVMEVGPAPTVVMPTRPLRKELRAGLQGRSIDIARDSMLHVPTAELPSSFVSELKHLASISNPEFYRRQAQRFSTFGVPRVVTSFEHDQRELRLPRGLADETRQLLKSGGAKVTIRQRGKRSSKNDIAFSGSLRPDQQQAVRSMVKHHDGVLVAPPGSGKTVIACALVAARRVPTAILVNRAELLHQWRERLTTFLDIEDQQIGQLGSGRKKRKGLVDLIMMQSVSRKGADPTVLEEYGQIIVDECHAIAAPSTEAAIRTVNVKYWAGLTATPFRADQMDGLITMQCGPIRHQMEVQGGEDRQLIIHQTRFTTEEPGTDGPSIQAIYSELSQDADRNELLVEQIVTAAAEQRTSMVLTNRVDHLKAMDALLTPKVAVETFALHGQLSAQERRNVREQIAAASEQNLPFVLLAIDKIAGEGLDIPSMDTLFLTMPVSFKGRIIQQAGRVTRGPGANGGSAVVHDFRDSEVPMLERMHRRRRRTLEAEGFRFAPS